MPVNPDEFRRALGRFASGVTVVTAQANGSAAGITVSAFASVSLQPPYILICIDKQSSTIPVLRAAGAFAVNFLNEDQAHLSNHFASKRADKFAGISCRQGQLGAPLLEDTLGYVECRVVREVDAGDHLLYLGQVEASDVDDTKRPLLYYHSQYHGLAPLSS
ncbi:MAG: flavin reductase family protein [Alicyclobacillus macrosporangiidus]|uniref:flavin reductase family protein n=1 Tax=Alicyclobacillus macrosporangiidus TaxID=392015 RepID=UPI0026EFA3FD|nr:flavin reductase family protein [Alicyclobacillus macrosporangiidus]MCL6598106.1 flavin reductase family protein [Alicyclobacillus macrosporangiidus]